MGDRIYKLTEVEFLQNDCNASDFDHKDKELPTITYTEATPSIRSEQILSVREKADNYLQHIESKEKVYDIYMKLMNRLKYEQKQAKLKLEEMNLILKKVNILKSGAEHDMEHFHDLNTQLEKIDQQIEFQLEQKETQGYLFKRNLDENRQKEEQISEMLSVVYHYAEVSEKWTNIKFISEKEKKEMHNKLFQSISIIRKRKNENKRKLKEKMNVLVSLNKMIDKYDEQLQDNHKNDLQSQGKLKMLQEKAEKMEQELKDEHNYLTLQQNQLKEYERQYDLLGTQFKVDDLVEFSKSASNVLAPQMQKQEREEAKIRNIMYQIGRMQWTKNKLLEELRNTKHRYEEEKTHEDEEMLEIEKNMRMKNNKIDQELVKQSLMKDLTKKNTFMIYKYLNAAINLSTKIDIKVKEQELSGVYFANDGRIIADFLNFKEIGQNEGFDDSKKRMVFRSILLLEKKLTLLFRDCAEKIDLNAKMELMRMQGSVNKHLIRTFNDMIYHTSSICIEYDPQDIYLRQAGSLLEQTSITNHGSSPRNNKNEKKKPDLQKIQKMRRQGTINTVGLNTVKNMSVMNIDLKKREAMRTLFKDAIVVKVSKLALQSKMDSFDIREKINMMHEKQDKLYEKDENVDNYSSLQTSKQDENGVALKLTKLDELFGNDSYIQDNNMIRRKWHLQNMSSLHKVENKFRQLNMMYNHITQSDLDLKHSKAYLETLIVNKKPGEINLTTIRSPTETAQRITELGDSMTSKSNRTSRRNNQLHEKVQSLKAFQTQSTFSKTSKRKKTLSKEPNGIYHSQKRLNSASTKQIHSIIAKQSQDMINSTKIESAMSQTNYQNNQTDDRGIQSRYFSGTPSINNNSKKKKISIDDSNLKNLASSKDNKMNLLRQYEKLRPTTAVVGNKQKKNTDLLAPLDHLSAINNYLIQDQKSNRTLSYQRKESISNSQSQQQFPYSIQQRAKAYHPQPINRLQTQNKQMKRIFSDQDLHKDRQISIAREPQQNTLQTEEVLRRNQKSKDILIKKNIILQTRTIPASLKAYVHSLK